MARFITGHIMHVSGGAESDTAAEIARTTIHTK
jgi:hypothetical protein